MLQYDHLDKVISVISTHGQEAKMIRTQLKLQRNEAFLTLEYFCNWNKLVEILEGDASALRLTAFSVGKQWIMICMF